MRTRGSWMCALLRRSLPFVLDEADLRQVALPAIADVEHEGKRPDPSAFRTALFGLFVAIVQAFLWRRGRRLLSGRWAGIVAIAIAAFTGVTMLARSARLGLAMGQLTFFGLGLLAAVAVATSERSSISAMGRVIGPTASALLVATSWLGVEQGGVARWLAVGPLTVQVSLLLWPWILLATADSIERRPWRASLVAGLALLGLVLQRDPTTAAVYGVAFVAIALRARRPAVAGTWAVSAAAVIAASWKARAALPPVEEVERAWLLSATLGPGFVALAALAAVLAAAAPWLSARRAGTSLAPFSLGALVALAMFVARPFIVDGEPVFFLGFSGSAIFGALCAAAVAATGSVRASSPPTPRSAVR